MSCQPLNDMFFISCHNVPYHVDHVRRVRHLRRVLRIRRVRRVRCAHCVRCVRPVMSGHIVIICCFAFF